MIEGQPHTGGMGDTIDAAVAARAEAVAGARAALDGFDLPADLRRTARLLVSELVTNSIRHTGLTRDDFIRIRGTWSGGVLSVSIREPQAPQLRTAGAIRPAPGASSGWGLYLVDRLATRWGVDPKRGYWFELEADRSANR